MRITVCCILFCIAIAAVTTPLEAAIVQYDDRAAWTAAVGMPTYAEDFEAFLVDTSFRMADGPLALNGMSIYEIGPVSELDVNFVDVAPFLYGSVNGTTSAEVGVDADSDPALETRVDITFDLPVSAWGADFARAKGEDELAVDVYLNGATLLGSLLISSDDPVFLGFAANAGEAVEFVRLRGALPAGPGTREGFSMDNVAIVAVPEPATMALLGTAACCLGGYVRRRRKA